MTDHDPRADSLPDQDEDPRSDLQQEVEARADAVARGEGGNHRSPLDDAGTFDGNSGTGGTVKNQDDMAQ
jgi:hypothetical protein